MNQTHEKQNQQRASHSRLWCPGLAFVTPQGDVRLGRSAGYDSDDSAFDRLRCGRRSSIAYWTHTAWLVPRTALDPALVAEHGIVLPEGLVDSDDQPHAHRWLREQPLVCVSGMTFQRLAAADVPTFLVGFDATGDRVLHIEGSGDPTGAASLAVGLDALENAATAASTGHPLLDVQGHLSPIDRVLRLLTGGTLDECSVLNAFSARGLVEDGYGYRGALEGQLTEIDRVQRALRPLDALFGQIFERARPLRTVAEGLLRALSHAPTNASEVEVPLYGTAHRVLIPALRVPRVAELVLRGRQESTLELSSERRWTVDGVDSWSPRLGSTDRPSK
jgi:hypothetical protein